MKEDRSRALGEVAHDLLSRLVRERMAIVPGGHVVEGTLDRILLRLPLRLAGDAAGFAEDLVSSIDALLEDEIHHAAAFRPGRAYCVRCAGALCEHSEPPSARHVFVEYAPTGIPRWEDLSQVCLDRRHPEVDRLFEDPPAFVTVLDDGTSLSARLVDAFRGTARHRLLGQIAAGYYRVRTREGEGRGVLAVTFQVSATRAGRRAGISAGLNVLGRAPFGGPLDRLWERQDEIPWRLPVRWAQSALTSLSRARLDEEDLVRRVDGVLRGLARRLTRDARSRGRRTRHAERRHLSGDRPTRKAVEDARRTSPRGVLLDERHDTLVVPGENGRTHFYTRDGRLVSSVRYSKGAIERKLQSGIWREAPRGEAEGLLRRLSDEAPAES